MTVYINPSNYAYGTLTAPIVAGDLTIQITTGAGASFPVLAATSLHAQQYYYLTLGDAATQGEVTREIVKVTGPSSGGTGTISLSVVRAQEGTTAKAFALGDVAQLRWTEQTALDMGYQNSCPPNWFNVKDFGAKGDGTTSTGNVNTSDATAIKAAIAAAFAASGYNGGGTVYFPIGRYLCGTSDWFATEGAGITFRGANLGTNFNEGAVDPTVDNIGSVILITNPTNVAFAATSESSADNISFVDLNFYYPNQNKNNAATPVVYPYTVQLSALGGTVERCWFMNSYNAIAIDSPQAQNSGIGLQRVIGCSVFAYNICIRVDKAGGTVWLHDLNISSGYDGTTNAIAGDGGLGDWSYNNGVGIDLYDARGAQISNGVIYGKGIGIRMNSTGYGFINNFDIGPSKYCIKALSNDPIRSWLVSDCIFANGTQPGPNSPVWLAAGGTGSAPVVKIIGGEIRDNGWTVYPAKVDVGQLAFLDTTGANSRGFKTPTGIGASPFTWQNTLNVPVMVTIAGGTVSKIEIQGVIVDQDLGTPPPFGDTLLTSGTFVLNPYENIKITYTVAPSWAWFEL
jgi:hypothetical protein